MPSVRDLRDRIRSLKNTQQITKAMKQVAAAKIRRAEQLQRQSRPYADAIAEMLRDLMASVGHVDHPFMKPGRAGAAAGVVVITADKGLAGAFNSNIIRAADTYRKERPDIRWYSVGIKGRNALRKFPQETARFWPQSQGDKLETAREICARVSEDFVDGHIGEIVLISSKFVSSSRSRSRRKPDPARELRGGASSSNPRPKPCSRGCSRSISSLRSTRRSSRPMRASSLPSSSR